MLLLFLYLGGALVEKNYCSYVRTPPSTMCVAFFVNSNVSVSEGRSQCCQQYIPGMFFLSRALRFRLQVKMLGNASVFSTCRTMVMRTDHDADVDKEDVISSFPLKYVRTQLPSPQISQSGLQRPVGGTTKKNTNT